MRVELYDHQRDVIPRINNGSILCGGTGSGKSRTSIAYYYNICGGIIPSSNNEDWTMYTKPLNLYIITTSAKRDKHEWESELAPFCIYLNNQLNFKKHIVVIDSWNNLHKYTNVTNSFFIFDEQRVTGSGQWVKSFLKVSKNNKWILLSATPGDTWKDYIPVFLANGFYKNRTEFYDMHVVFTRFVSYPKIDKYINIGKLIQNRNKVLIMMKPHVTAIKRSYTIKCDFNSQLFNEARKNRWDVIEDKPIENASQLFYIMRKIVNSDPSRIETLLRLIKKHNKVIIFYNFDYELDILKEVLDKCEIPYGQMNGHAHTQIPATDQWAYLVQYASGAEGWNCILTNTIIFYSQSYSYKATIQACGRVDRLNTPFKELYYYHLISDSYIDIAIHKCLMDKKTFNESSTKLFKSFK